MIQLKNWYLERKGERYRLWGNVYNDPRFTQGQWIHTSSIRQMNADRYALNITTGSTQYECRYEDHRDVDLRVLKLGLRDFLWPEDTEAYNRIIRADRQKEERKERNIPSPQQLSTCSVFTFSTSAANGFISLDVKLRGKIYHSISYDLHKGMYEDYMEVSDPNLGYDFRFFAYRRNAFQFEPWSDRYAPVFMKNTGRESIVATTPYGEFTVMPGDTVLLGSEDDLNRNQSGGRDEPSYDETTVISHQSTQMKNI